MVSHASTLVDKPHSPQSDVCMSLLKALLRQDCDDRMSFFNAQHGSHVDVSWNIAAPGCFDTLQVSSPCESSDRDIVDEGDVSRGQ